jgi:hypothetical protein
MELWRIRGLTPEQIHEKAPHWLIFRDGCPGGEMPEQVGVRVDRSLPGSALLLVTSLYSRTDMYSAAWWPDRLGWLESISCSIRALCASCPTTTNFPLSGCGMAL